MSIEIISNIVPRNNADFPVTDASLIKGGFFSVATTGHRNDIPTLRRATGMLIHVQANNTIYQLVSGITNNDWSFLTIGSSSSPGTGFVYTQSPASNAWTINHNLGYKPSVNIADSSGNTVFGYIEHPSINQSVLYFGKAIEGTAVLS